MEGPLQLQYEIKKILIQANNALFIAIHIKGTIVNLKKIMLIKKVPMVEGIGPQRYSA